MPPLTILPFSREYLSPGDRLCVAVSGGADSVALLSALHAANQQPRNALGAVLSAIHVHHNLRGAEADADAAFVADLCKRLDIPFHLREVDVPARLSATAETLEEAARNLRYAAFYKIMADGEANAVLTAHTLDDQAETVLMKLLRGAWTDGLSAIHPVVHPAPERAQSATGKIVRPLLATSRTQIEAYLTDLKQSWREDSSNTDTLHTRNRIRHQVMPLLRTFNPNLEQALGNLADLAREEESRWQTELARLLPQLLLPGKPVRGGGRSVATNTATASLAVEIERLRVFDLALRRRILRAAARQLGARLSFEETARLLALCGLQTHPTVTPRSGATLQLSNHLRAERSIRELWLFCDKS